MNVIAGVDIGGTHITAALVNPDSKKLIHSTFIRKAVNPMADSETIIRNWCDAIRLSHEAGGCNIEKIGIAMPGPFDYEGGISWITNLNKFESLYGYNVKSLLAEQLFISTEQIEFKNDAQAFLAGELICGCAVGRKNVVGITLGTGLGSATFYNNKPEEGFLYRARYKEGIAEDYLSAQWFVSQYREMTGCEIKGVKELAENFEKDTVASLLFETFGANLAEVLNSNYKSQEPEMIFIGGNITKAWDLFIPSFTSTLKKYGSSFKIEKAALGESAALIGACCKI